MKWKEILGISDSDRHELFYLWCMGSSEGICTRHNGVLQYNEVDSFYDTYVYVELFVRTTDLFVNGRRVTSVDKSVSKTTVTGMIHFTFPTGGF